MNKMNGQTRYLKVKSDTLFRTERIFNYLPMEMEYPPGFSSMHANKQIPYAIFVEAVLWPKKVAILNLNWIRHF